MERIENVKHGAKHSYTETPNFFSRCITTYWAKFSKHIAIYLCYTKYNEIGICYSDVQKHVFYKKKNDLNSVNILYTSLHKISPIHYGLWGGGRYF